jgi:acetyltransferase-like isoleucine patch superfamily enzyme
MGDFSSLSSGVKIWCASDDFVNDLVTIIPDGAGPIKKNFITGNVVLEDYTAIGANSVVMPKNVIPVGTVIGALSFVPAGSKLEAWTVYAGSPIRKIKARNKKSVLEQAERMRSKLKAGS